MRESTWPCVENVIPGIANDERSENGSNSSSRSSNADGGSASADELGSRVNVGLGGGGGEQLGGLGNIRERQRQRRS